MQPKQVTLADLPTDFVVALEALYGTANGHFLLGNHGITHFTDVGIRGAKVVVLSHGIGSKLEVFGPISDQLAEAGYRVISYSFIGHSWSCAMDENCTFEWDMFSDQVSELLDYLLEEGEPVHLWVGHSTGGVVGVLAAESLDRRFEQLALISPAFWANKPILATLADKIPRVMGLAATYLPFLVEKTFLENCDAAFAQEESTYLCPHKQEATREEMKQMFKLHPQVNQAILKTNLNFLRGDLLGCHRVKFKELLQQEDGPRICLIWGTLDIVVPFLHAKVIVNTNPDRVTLYELPNVGHEALTEAPALVSQKIIKFLQTAPVQEAQVFDSFFTPSVLTPYIVRFQRSNLLVGQA